MAIHLTSISREVEGSGRLGGGSKKKREYEGKQTSGEKEIPVAVREFFKYLHKF
jgi:hypothetical protein